MEGTYVRGNNEVKDQPFFHDFLFNGLENMVNHGVAKIGILKNLRIVEGGQSHNLYARNYCASLIYKETGNAEFFTSNVRGVITLSEKLRNGELQKIPNTPAGRFIKGKYIYTISLSSPSVFMNVY